MLDGILQFLGIQANKVNEQQRALGSPKFEWQWKRFAFLILKCFIGAEEKGKGEEISEGGSKRGKKIKKVSLKGGTPLFD